MHPYSIAIVGPTSSGKSEFAVRLAQRIGGEIISADSRQVYKGLDLLSGKISKSDMGGIRHHMLSIRSSKKPFSAGEFARRGKKILRSIQKRGTIPIIVGGSGFYVDALISDKQFPDVPRNASLRKQLEQYSASALYDQLKALDPERASEIDRNNRVRLIRAIEIAQAIGKVPHHRDSKKSANVIWIYLDVSDTRLKQRIRNRLQERIARGMIREIHQLRRSGVSWKRIHELGLECRYCALSVQKKIAKELMVPMLEQAIWHYAKRQRTWFKKYIPRDAVITVAIA